MVVLADFCPGENKEATTNREGREAEAERNESNTNRNSGLFQPIHRRRRSSAYGIGGYLSDGGDDVGIDNNGNDDDDGDVNIDDDDGYDTTDAIRLIQNQRR